MGEPWEVNAAKRTPSESVAGRVQKPASVVAWLRERSASSELASHCYGARSPTMQPGA
jgi:hypothetical protein